MNNKPINEISKNFSDNINNFNLCDNPFISNGNKNKSNREKVTDILFNEQDARNTLKNISQSATSNFFTYQADKLKLQNSFFENHVDQLNKSAFNKNKREIMQHPMLNKRIRDNSFRQFLLVNKLYQSEEYNSFKDRFEKISKRLNVTMGGIIFYSMYILMNVYESKLRIYETTADLISDKKTYLGKINYKLHFTVMLPLFGIIYYLKKKRNLIEDDFHKVIKDKYFDDSIDFNYVKVTLR
jgi:hypothetical protein